MSSDRGDTDVRRVGVGAKIDRSTEDHWAPLHPTQEGQAGARARGGRNDRVENKEPTGFRHVASHRYGITKTYKTWHTTI